MKRNEFIKLLKNLLKDEGHRFFTTRELGNSIIHIEKDSIVKRLYIKESNISKPFWGLTENRLRRLEIDKSVKGYLVILLSNNNITVLSSDAINALLSNKKVAGDGDYKINARDVLKMVA